LQRGAAKSICQSLQRGAPKSAHGCGIRSAEDVLEAALEAAGNDALALFFAQLRNSPVQQLIMECAEVEVSIACWSGIGRLPVRPSVSIAYWFGIGSLARGQASGCLSVRPSVKWRAWSGRQAAVCPSVCLCDDVPGPADKQLSICPSACLRL
jgi:hypothetical protein